MSVEKALQYVLRGPHLAVGLVPITIRAIVAILVVAIVGVRVRPA